ncbi:hypothetical protein BH23ACT9_BH23ACT9_23900 [soil metagenome]
MTRELVRLARTGGDTDRAVQPPSPVDLGLVADGYAEELGEWQQDPRTRGRGARG